jgi:hypothetical protein
LLNGPDWDHDLRVWDKNIRLGDAIIQFCAVQTKQRYENPD